MSNLKSLLLEILSEVSIEQLKQQFVPSKVSEKDFQDIVDASNNKSSYATWLIKKVVDKIIEQEDVYKFKEYFDLFDKNKNRYKYKDISQYKNKNDVDDFIDTTVKIKDEIKKDPSKNKGVDRADKYKEFEIGKIDGFTIYELPKGRTDLYGISCDLGSGTEWCTATGKTRDFFNKYIKEGPLFIFIKLGSNEKYQFSYETGHFMDKDDKRIDMEDDQIYRFFDYIEQIDPTYPIPEILLARRRFLKGEFGEGDTITVSNQDIKNEFPNIKNLTVEVQGKDTLILDNIINKSLPKGLTIIGNLKVSNCKNLVEIPKDTNIGRDLLIIDNCPKLKIIPSKIYQIELDKFNELLINTNYSTIHCDSSITEIPDNTKAPYIFTHERIISSEKLRIGNNIIATEVNISIPLSELILPDNTKINNLTILKEDWMDWDFYDDIKSNHALDIANYYFKNVPANLRNIINIEFRKGRSGKSIGFDFFEKIRGIYSFYKK